MIPQWPNEALEDAKEYKKYDLILITPIPSNISFKIMEDYGQKCSFAKMVFIKFDCIGRQKSASQKR